MYASGTKIVHPDNIYYASGSKIEHLDNIICKDQEESINRSLVRKGLWAFP
jgi:hypothetical protein